MFVVFEGIDGSGKTTQLERFADWLRDAGHDVETCIDPGSTLLGHRIRQLVLECHDVSINDLAEMFLFMTAHAQLVSDVIRPALARGQIVLCDRFLISTVVYQGHAGTLDPETIWRIGQVATGGLAPDRTIIFDMPVADAECRMGPRRDRLESRGSEFMERVRQGFLKEAARDPVRHWIIDSRGTIDEVAARLVERWTAEQGKVMK